MLAELDDIFRDIENLTEAALSGKPGHSIPREVLTRMHGTIDRLNQMPSAAAKAELEKINELFGSKNAQTLVLAKALINAAGNFEAAEEQPERGQPKDRHHLVNY